MRVGFPAGRGRHKLLPLCCVVGLLSLTLSACQIFGNERLIYDRQGVQIGLQTDPSVQRSPPAALNTHPIDLTPQELLVLLGAVRVSGWSGTIVGWFDAPRSIPLFDEADLRVMTVPITEAFRQATPAQRVFFSLPNPASAYGDATTGSLFMRGSHLHLVVTDHKAFARADTAGGDEKDVRDTKGMKLGVAQPHRPATLSASEEPNWAPFETVHLSLNVKDLLADGSLKHGAGTTTKNAPVAAGPAPVATEPAESQQELRLQIRELTQSNLELRERLNRQMQQLEDLKEEVTRLRRESDGVKSKKPAARKPSQ